MNARAYTVASLAEAWHCSEGVIRKAIANGELGCFRLGTLIRIPAEEVARFECQNIPSSGSSDDMPSSGETAKASAIATALPRPTALELRLRHGEFGREGAVRTGPWAGS